VRRRIRSAENMVMPSSLRQFVIAHFFISASTTGGIPPRRGIRVRAMVRRMRKQPKLVICEGRIESGTVLAPLVVLSTWDGSQDRC
jgi:hypothetical protein